jgi:3-oxoacyl-[acyl-carrier-protein] synthase-3
MAFFSIKHTAIRGIAAAVPKNKVSNHDLTDVEGAERDKLINTLGIEYRRVAPLEMCASDLVVASAERLLKELNWHPSDIDVLVFVSQTPDHVLPGSSMHIQQRLGLPATCAVFDVNQGCAGYVYGLSLISGFMSASGLQKGLLLVGDTITRLISPHDKSLIPIFSDAGTATALELDHGAAPMVFNTNSIGADYEAIIVREGGARYPINASSLQFTEYEGGVRRAGSHLAMKGLDVFNFSLKKVAPNVNELLEKAGQAREEIDFFIFHQANRLILEAIGKKLNIPASRIPSTLRAFGNTSGATVPLTIVANLRTENKIVDSKLLLSGFGVGLSLASAIVDFRRVTCPEIIEL